MAMAMSRPLKPESGREMTSILEAIEYYNVHIAPDLVATGIIGPQSPYFMPHSTAAVLPQAFNETIHRGNALRALARDIAEPERQTADLTLASVHLLLLVEIQQSFDPPNWRHHCDGAAAMMEAKGGLGDLILSRPHLCHLFRYYALHLELVSLLPVLFGNGLETCFPCPSGLLAAIIRINHLRAVFQQLSNPQNADFRLVQEGKHTAALDILRHIRAFSADKWAAEISANHSTQENAVSRAGLSGWWDIGLIYQSAIAIYCILSLLQDTVHTGLLAGARVQCATVLHGRLREVSKSTQLRKLVIWPLVIAGIEARDDASKRFVVDELQWVSHALGTAAPLVAKDLLEKHIWGLWKANWDDLFDQPYVFVL
ncbi:hypothetical protein N0V88_007533 [Collariella sp. IMI 366227]|nr:hypothetical protein N0V88_007533 [Collariella sp. IMI 366227]